MNKEERAKAPPIILDLCGGSGAWSAPYKEAGYDVRLITLPQDVRLLEFPGQVHGILAAPPCTIFSKAATRYWKKRTDADWREAISVVDACFRLVAVCKPKWWALENPEGRIRHYIGKPAATFHPWEYGHPYTKKTLLWGNFTMPAPTKIVIPKTDITQIVRKPELRAITPKGFADAFFVSNP